MGRKSEAVSALDALVGKRKNKKQKNKNRKIGRNFRWNYESHSMTKYRLNGRRERNKTRKAAQRLRRLARAKARRETKNGNYSEGNTPTGSEGS